MTSHCARRPRPCLPLLRILSLWIGRAPTGVRENNTPLERRIRENASLQSTKSGAGLQLLLWNCRAKRLEQKESCFPQKPVGVCRREKSAARRPRPRTTTTSYSRRVGPGRRLRVVSCTYHRCYILPFQPVL